MRIKLLSFYVNFKNSLKNKFTISLISLIILFSIIANLVAFINRLNLLSIIEITSTLSFIMIFNSILIVLLLMSITLKLFWYDFKDGIHKIELRVGINILTLFTIRFLIILLVTLIILLVNLLSGSLFYWLAFSWNSRMAYKVFLTPIGWYSIISMITIFISMLFSIVFNSKNTPIIATAIMTIFIIWVPVSGQLLTPKVSEDINNDNNTKSGWITKWELRATALVSYSMSFLNYQIINSAISNDKEMSLYFQKNVEGVNPSEINVDQMQEDLINTAFAREIKNISSNLNSDFYEIEDYQIIAIEFKNSSHLLVRAFGELLENSELKIFNEIDIPYFIYENPEQDTFEIIYDNLCLYLLKSFSAFNFGLELNLDTRSSLKLIENLNKKISTNIMINPFYQLNLLFFGDFWNDNYLDNLVHFNRPLFSSTLNLNVELDSNYNLETDSLQLKTVVIKKALNINYQYFIYNLLLISFTILQYFSFKKRARS